MGNWNMTIQGVGPHGNGVKEDIEQIYKRVLEEVKNAGHNIVHSSVTSGGAYFDPAFIPPVKKGGVNVADVHVEVQKIAFDISDPEVTKVTVDIKHDDDGILLKNRYEKTFPARIPILDIIGKHLFGENGFLTWGN